MDLNVPTRYQQLSRKPNPQIPTSNAEGIPKQRCPVVNSSENSRLRHSFDLGLRICATEKRCPHQAATSSRRLDVVVNIQIILAGIIPRVVAPHTVHHQLAE